MFLPPEVPLVLYLMMAGVTLVLFIACSNVANLLLARASGRRREFAVRTAIGAGRRQIVRQLLTESVVLGALSVPLGVALALAGTRLIACTDAARSGAVLHPLGDRRTFARLHGCRRHLDGAGVRAVPALQASRGNVHESLKEGTRGNSIRRSLLRSSLVVVQMSLALVALVGALLFVRTFINLDSYEVGFDTTPMMSMRFYMTGERYEPQGAKARRVEDIVKRIEGLPGVQAAFASSLVPLWGGGGGGQVEIDGKPFMQGAASGDHLYRGHTAFLSQRSGAGDARPRFHGRGGLVAHTGRGGQPDDGEPALDRWRRRRRPFSSRNDDDSRPSGSPSSASRRIELFGIDPSATAPPAAAFVPYAYQQVLSTGMTIRVAGDPASITPAARAEIRAVRSEHPDLLGATLEASAR